MVLNLKIFLLGDPPICNLCHFDISKMCLLISIPLTFFTPRVTHVKNGSIFHQNTKHLHAFMFRQYVANIILGVSV